MVAAVPQHLVDAYGHWTEKIPPEVLRDLTEKQVHNRLKKAQDHYAAALGEGGHGDLPKAMTEAGEILAAPAPGARKAERPTALKAAGITGDDMERHGRWISRIPDETLSKMDRPDVIKRAEVAAAEYARTGSIPAADHILTQAAYVPASVPMTREAQAACGRGVREDLARQYGRWIAHVPDAVLAKLDAAELVDRCEHAIGLEQRGKANEWPGMLVGYLDRARQTLRSMPRAEVEVEAARLEKAARLADEPRLTRGYLDRAQTLRQDNPQAPSVPRPLWLGKALRVPEPATRPAVLCKAQSAPTKPRGGTAKPPGKRRKGTLSKADAVRLGTGLAALEEALKLLKANLALNKSDAQTRDRVQSLLDTTHDAF